MRIAYFGGDMFYACMELLMEKGHEIIALYTNPPDADEYDYIKNVCRQGKKFDIPILYSKPTNDDIKALQQKGCDMIFSAGYRHKIPPWQGGSIRYGANVHPSLLPEGGGPMPLPLVIVKGLKKTGVTLHKLSQKWDEGDIILQEKIILQGNENIEGLLQESQAIARKLLRRFLDSPEKCWDDAFPQIHKPGDYWPMAHPDSLIVDYHKNVEIVEKYLRAHRYISPDGMVESISAVSFWREKHNHEPGTIISQENNIYTMAAADGLVTFTLEHHQIK